MLKNSEQYNHYCNECNCDIHPDMIDSHKCSKFKDIKWDG